MTDVRVQENVWTGQALERAAGRVWECLEEVVPGGDIRVQRGASTSEVSPSELIPLPVVGQVVSFGDRRGHWMGVKAVDAAEQSIGYWVLDESRTVQVGRCTFDDLASTPAPWLEPAASGGLTPEALVCALAQTLVQSQDRMDRITQRLHSEADDRGYCSEFDEIMEEIGLPSRRTEHELTVEVEAFTMTVTVEARNREAAIDELTQERVDSTIHETVNYRNLDYQVID